MLPCFESLFVVDFRSDRACLPFSESMPPFDGVEVK